MYVTMDKIKWLKRTCGTYATAKYMRNNGYSLNVALACLAKRGSRV